MGPHTLSQKGGPLRKYAVDKPVEGTGERKQEIIERRLIELQERYGLDFAGHMEDILHGRVLYRTIEYMRKHYKD